MKMHVCFINFSVIFKLGYGFTKKRYCTQVKNVNHASDLIVDIDAKIRLGGPQPQLVELREVKQGDKICKNRRIALKKVQRSQYFSSP